MYIDQPKSHNHTYNQMPWTPSPTKQPILWYTCGSQKDSQRKGDPKTQYYLPTPRLNSLVEQEIHQSPAMEYPKPPCNHCHHQDHCHHSQRNHCAHHKHSQVMIPQPNNNNHDPLHTMQPNNYQQVF